jgi:type IV secretory pathway component VirB8
MENNNELSQKLQEAEDIINNHKKEKAKYRATWAMAIVCFITIVIIVIVLWYFLPLINTDPCKACEALKISNILGG